MAQQILNQFSQFELTPDEQTAGEMLTVTQVQVIRNLLAAEAIKRIGLTYNPNEPMHFMQQEAEIQGAISAYTMLLESSELAFAKAHVIALEEAEENLDFVVDSELPVTQRIFDTK